MSGGSYTTFGLSARYRGRIHPFLLTITEHNAPGMEYRKCEVCGTQRNLLLFYSRLRQGRDGHGKEMNFMVFDGSRCNACVTPGSFDLEPCLKLRGGKSALCMRVEARRADGSLLSFRYKGFGTGFVGSTEPGVRLMARVDLTLPDEIIRTRLQPRGIRGRSADGHIYG